MRTNVVGAFTKINAKRQYEDSDDVIDSIENTLGATIVFSS